jgi:1-deoxy-D-xylulose-5-phosphate reductoisomerase
MNKGLEVIEANRLFGVSPDAIEVVVHPQSVGALAGGIRRRLGARRSSATLTCARRSRRRSRSCAHRRGCRAALDLVARGKLTFEAPDHARFPCLRLAYDALRGRRSRADRAQRRQRGRGRRVPRRPGRFDAIAATAGTCSTRTPGRPSASLDDALACDAARAARRALPAACPPTRPRERPA